VRLSPDTILGDLAARHPQTVPVLLRFGIELTRGTSSPLAQVCRDHRLSYAEVALALSVVLGVPSAPADWATRPLADLTRHATTAFHAPLRTECARIQGLATRVQGHGNGHRRALAVILQELSRMRGELEAHMRAEERELFPLIETLAAGEIADEVRGRFVHLRSAVEAEHVDAVQTLRMFQQLTDGYRPPNGTCSMVHELYRGLEELQRLESRHASFEQEFLFPRASSRLVPLDE
jgi:regulator of cell morphogenesis and NO signaling